MKLKTAALFTILSILACNDDDDGNKACNCRDASTTTTFTVGEGKVYLPNVFTPNFDGINDQFFPFATNGVDRISITIKDSDGTVLAEYNNVQPNDPALGWPQNSDEAFDGIIKYSVVAMSTNGDSEVLVGTACSKPYNSTSLPTDWEGCEKCRFPTQHDGLGGFDGNLPSFETICK